MKNPLADALRRAHGSDQSLTDSGSYDALGEGLGPTANDESVDAESLDELELLHATGALLLDDGGIRVETTAPAVDVEPPAVAGMPASRQAVPGPPPLARYAPLICLVAAMVSAGSWALYSRLEAHFARSGIGAAPPDSRGGIVLGESGAAGDERFPFRPGTAKQRDGDAE